MEGSGYLWAFPPWHEQLGQIFHFFARYTVEKFTLQFSAGKTMLPIIEPAETPKLFPASHSSKDAKVSELPTKKERSGVARKSLTQVWEGLVIKEN